MPVTICGCTVARCSGSNKLMIFGVCVAVCGGGPDIGSWAFGASGANLILLVCAFFAMGGFLTIVF